MKGTKSSYNCYMWCPQEKNKLQQCMIFKVDETKLWHRKLGHLNLRSMRKIASEKIPSLVFLISRSKKGRFLKNVR